MNKSILSGIVSASTSPRCLASLCHSAEYASPSNRTFPPILNASFAASSTASMGSFPSAIRASVMAVTWSIPHAQRDANIVTGSAMLWLAPGARNSNLSPVKATGLVLFLSESNGIMSGSFASPRSITPFSGRETSALSSLRIKSVRAEPRYTLMIDGGASCPPSLKRFPAVATEACNKLWNFDTPSTTADRNARKTTFRR